MKIGIIALNPKLYSIKRLMEAGKARGHKMQTLDPLACYMNVNSSDNKVHYKNKALKLDAVVPRIGSGLAFYGTAVIRQFETANVYTLNGSLGVARARDKLRAHQILARKKLGMPITAIAHSTENVNDLIQMVGGTPVVIKLLEGAQGRGLILAETKKAAESVIETLRELDAYFLIQEFIKESSGQDIRCFVIGDKVVGSMIRTAKEGDFRSNLHRGGTAEAVRITPTERKTAIAAAKALGLDVAGVDLVRSNRGPLILEVNSSPGLQGIEEATGQDIATMMIEHIEREAVKDKSKKKAAQ
ncbi:MAG: 30S ribosomal protein S6--L-glutamate ligase [Alphaproteobacteria bacterium]|nr:30S ribosomal protein S6--L-glutamate ligase [Alphaproteobacteria bacterium]